jgi:hypothetical protein
LLGTNLSQNYNLFGYDVGSSIVVCIVKRVWSVVKSI